MVIQNFLLVSITAAMIYTTSCVDLQVRIAGTQSKFSATDSVNVILSYTNIGKDTIFIYKWLLADGKIYDPILRVTFNNVLVKYQGPLIKRRTPTIDDTISIAPGETRSIVLSVSSVYNMTRTGPYSIHFEFPVASIIFNQFSGSRIVTTEQNIDFQSNIRSNNIDLDAEGRLNVNQRAKSINSIATKVTSISYTSCTRARKSKIITSVQAATEMSAGAVNYLTNTAASETTRYKTWFGAFTQSNWDTVKQHYENILSSLRTKPLSFDCVCADVDYAGTYAYVFADSPYTIHLCGAFWNTNIVKTDSTAGTIIHEMSHFTVVANTEDHAYGQEPCKNLALQDPLKAITNADSHEFFAENNPVLS